MHEIFLTSYHKLGPLAKYNFRKLYSDVVTDSQKLHVSLFPFQDSARDTVSLTFSHDGSNQVLNLHLPDYSAVLVDCLQSKLCTHHQCSSYGQACTSYTLISLICYSGSVLYFSGSILAAPSSPFCVHCGDDVIGIMILHCRSH